jgi:hypothetical protein
LEKPQSDKEISNVDLPTQRFKNTLPFSYTIVAAMELLLFASPASSPPSAITQVAALLGMVLGTAGLVISLMNYLRDRPRVTVRLKWDMSVMDNPRYDTKKKWGIVTVTNAGRRPVFISIAALTVPKGFEMTHLILSESASGNKLSEGDAPARFMVNQDDLEKYRDAWREVRAYVEDSTGKRYLSKRLNKSDIPSWARG